MSDTFKPLIPVTDFVTLAGLGHSEGSEVGIVVNVTRKWREAFAEQFDWEAGEEESAESLLARRLARQYELLASVLTHIKFTGGGGWERKPVTPEDVRYMDEEIDSRVMDVVVTEIIERSVEGVVNTKTSFRTERSSVLKRRQENENQAAAVSHNGTERDAGNQ